MAFKMKGYPMHEGTAAYKKAASAFKDNDPKKSAAEAARKGEVKTEEQLLAEKEAIDARKEHEAEQRKSNPEFNESVQVRQDATKDTPGLYGKYGENKMKNKLQDWKNVTSDEKAKLARSLEPSAAGQWTSTPKTRAWAKSLLEADKRAAEDRTTGGVAKFEKTYFEARGITNPTDAQYRVMQRAYEKSK